MIKDFKTYITEGRMGKLIDAAKTGEDRKEDNRIFRLDDGRYFDFSDDDRLFFKLKKNNHFRKISYDSYDVYELECIKSDSCEDYVYLTYDEDNETGYSGRFFTPNSIIDDEDYGKSIGALANIDSSASYVLNLNDDNKHIEVLKSGTHYEVNMPDNDDETWWVFWSYDDAVECAKSIFKDDFEETHTDMFEKNNYIKETQFDRYKRILGNDRWFDYDKLEQCYLNDYCDDECGDEGYRGEDLLDYFLSIMGSEHFFNLCMSQNLIDVDELASQAIENDGVALNVSNYSEEEFESKFDGKTYYSYRVK